MSIEARGAKDAYLYFFSGSLTRGHVTKIYHSTAFDVADSEDEAYGRAMKIAHASYRPQDGWHSHFVQTVKISDIGWVGRQRFDKVKPLRPSDA